MDELLEQFLIEGRELVAEAHVALTALGRNAQDRLALDRLFRATHTLKGSVALFDMAPVQHLLHAAETRLDAVRKGERSLDTPARDALIAVIDQTDRWIDAMEVSGSLEVEAAGQASRLIARIEADVIESEQPEPHTPPSPDPDWLVVLRGRPDFAQLDPQQRTTAFRYTPDPDCFFRGEDPLAIVAPLPGLAALAILPADGAWPDLAACEPFRCMAVIEGVSSASETDVRAALRLVADQILVGPFDPASDQAGEDGDLSKADVSTLFRVDSARLDRLADQSGELAVAIGGLRPITERLRALDPHLAADLSMIEGEIIRVAGALQRSVTQVRLVSLEPVLRRLPRLARDAAASLDKALRFTLDGEMTQVDKQIADQIFEPLLHLVRNAVDHGIEPQSERSAGGKAAEGTLRLSVRQDGDNVTFTLIDDGRGIDPAAIRKAAVAKGLIDGEAADALDDAATLRLIFLPGFSTAARTTSLSGRGVGMDAVQATVERLSGTIAIDSKIGTGTSITLRLPANAISTPLLLVGIGDQQLGIRLDQIVETVRIAATTIQPVGQGQAFVLRDATVPVLDLAALLGLPAVSDDLARLVVTDIGGSHTALRVTRFGERFDAVVRDASRLLATVPAVAGTAMMADGSILLILDLPELLA